MQSSNPAMQIVPHRHAYARTLPPANDRAALNDNTGFQSPAGQLISLTSPKRPQSLVQP